MITVLGIGNPIMGDDGIGLALLTGIRAELGAASGESWIPSECADFGALARNGQVEEGSDAASVACVPQSDTGGATSAAPGASVPQGDTGGATSAAPGACVPQGDGTSGIDEAPHASVPQSDGITREEAANGGSGASEIEFIDGGTSGMELLPIIQTAEKLLVLDAVAATAPDQVPGTVIRLHGDQVPRLQQAKLSPHQVSFLDLLASARLLGAEPGELAVVGIVPESTDLGVGLSSPVTATLPEAVTAAVEIIRAWQE